jgi:hypothetical protein
MSRVLAHSPKWVAGVALLVSVAVPLTVFGQPLPRYPQLPSPPSSPAAPTPAKPEPAKPEPAKPAAPAGAERDPFDPLVTKAPEGETRPSLSGVRLVGVIWDPVRRDQIRALVETPDGLGYYVRLNEEKFGGKVVAIERDRVRFSIREQDPSGQSRVRTVELKLSQ